MPALLLSALTSKWTYIAIAFSAVLAWGGWQKLDNWSLESKNAGLTIQVQDLTGKLAASEKQIGRAHV